MIISGSDSSLFATGTEAGQPAEPRIHKMNKCHPTQGRLPHHRSVCVCVCERERCLYFSDTKPNIMAAENGNLPIAAGGNLLQSLWLSWA